MTQIAALVDIKGEQVWAELVHENHSNKLCWMFESSTNTYFACDKEHIVSRQEFPSYDGFPKAELQK